MKFWETLKFLLFFLLLFLGAILYEWTFYYKDILPEKQESKDSFLRRVELKVRSIEGIQRDGKDYTVVILDTGSGILHLPSGPPVYVFSDNDKLYDWTYDVGEYPAFAARWLKNSGNQ